MTEEQLKLIKEVHYMIVSCSIWRPTESRVIKKMIEKLDKVIAIDEQLKTA